MKNIFLGILTLSLLFFSSCGLGKKENPVIGKWKLVKMDVPALDLASNLTSKIDSIGLGEVDTNINKVAGAIENLSNSFGTMGESILNNALKGSVFSFEEKGILHVSQLVFSQEGKYKIDKDLKEMVVTIDKQDMLFTVLKFTEEEMILKSSFGEEWVFERK